MIISQGGGIYRIEKIGEREFKAKEVIEKVMNKMRDKVGVKLDSKNRKQIKIIKEPTSFMCLDLLSQMALNEKFGIGLLFE